MAKPIVVLIDAVSSGRYLKQPVLDLGYDLILVNTLTEEQLIASAKNGGSAVTTVDEFYATDINLVEDRLTPYKPKIKGIVAASEPGVEFADVLAKRFGLQGNSPETTGTRRDKYKMREALKGSTYIVDYQLCSDVDKAVSFARNNSFPLVVKALNSAGNDHVYFCDTEQDVADAAGKALRSTTIFGDPISDILVEQYIGGELLVVEFFVSNNTFLTTSIWDIEMIEIKETNARIFKTFRRVNDQSRINVISRIAKDIAGKTGVSIGPGLLELKFDKEKDEYKFIEIGSRLSGIDLPKIQQQTTDFDPFENTINCFTIPKYKLASQVRLKGYAELYFIEILNSGKLVAINGLDRIASLSSFYSQKIICKVGSFIEKTKDQSTLAAIIYLTHQSDEQIQDDKLKINEFFELVYEEH